MLTFFLSWPLLHLAIYLHRSFFEVLEEPSTNRPNLVLQAEAEPSWIDPIFRYLAEGSLPPDREEAWKHRIRASRFIILEGKLYKRGFSQPLLRCLLPSKAIRALHEVHKGTCGSHLGGRSLSHKILRQGYYWPTMKQDTNNMVRKCDKCQCHSNIQRLPSALLTSLISP